MIKKISDLFYVKNQEEHIFKTKKMTEAAEEKIREAEEAQAAAKPVKELLESYESARSEKIPFSGKKKETEIIALRMKNSELEKQNNVLAKDNGDLYSELKRKEKTATTNEGAVKLLEKLLKKNVVHLSKQVNCSAVNVARIWSAKAGRELRECIAIINAPTRKRYIFAIKNLFVKNGLKIWR